VNSVNVREDYVGGAEEVRHSGAPGAIVARRGARVISIGDGGFRMTKTKVGVEAPYMPLERIRL